MPDKHKIAVVGVGKIAVDQHLPVIDKSDRFELAATVSGRGIAHGGKPVYRTTAEFYAAHPDVNLVALCMPPGVRHGYAREAIDAGKHVLLEKPPTASIAEFDDMVAHSRNKGRVLFQTWHSRYNPAVDRAREILASEGIAKVRIDWRESVRKWHPGQDWVWEPGGFGVCDPGINALSIFTEIMPEPVFVDDAVLGFPENRHTPVDVRLRFRTAGSSGPDLTAHFNWLEETGEVWQIRMQTGTGRDLLLDKGGTVLIEDGNETLAAPSEEYERIYQRFSELLDKGESETDASPLTLLADAFLSGQREILAPFEW